MSLGTGAAGSVVLGEPRGGSDQVQAGEEGGHDLSHHLADERVQGKPESAPAVAPGRGRLDLMLRTEVVLLVFEGARFIRSSDNVYNTAARTLRMHRNE